MNKETEAWKYYRLEQKQRRAERLPKRTEEILSLRESGFEVKQLTPYQFRINGAVDVYPIHNRFHELKSQWRGGYQDLNHMLAKTKLKPALPAAPEKGKQ